MNQIYIVLRGVTPSAVFRSGIGAPMAAEILHFQNEQMKSAAAALLEAGVPMRHILMPYVDTVLMDEKTPAFYFGASMILCGEAHMLDRALKQTELENSSLSVKKLPDADAVTRYLNRDVPVTRVHAMPVPYRRTFAENVQLVSYTFTTQRLAVLPEYPMDYRALSRAVLAFGDILGRAVRKQGGQVLYCAGDRLICVWEGREPKNMETVLQQTFRTQLAATIGSTTPMKRQVYTGEAVT